MYKSLETEVLVIGGGGAGCRAAIEAHDNGSKVMMMLKGKLGNSGCTLWVGISSAVGSWGGDKADTTDTSMIDLLSYGGYLGNQDLAKILSDESADRVHEMEEWGIDFRRNEDGSVFVDLDPEHTYARSFYFKIKGEVDGDHHNDKYDYGSQPGHAIMDILTEQVSKRDITVKNNTVLIDLLVNSGRVVGALGLDCENNELVVIKAKSVVLATGSYSHIFAPTTVSPFETGDGHGAAYRAGAELIDMETCQYVATDRPFKPESVFLNIEGEDIMPKYGIDLKSRDKATKEYMCYAIWKEVMEGKGTDKEKVYIDVDGNRNPSSPLDKLIQTAPQAHTTIGGVKINDKCETSLPGLYAGGAIGGGVYGHARPQGYTSMITLVFGRIAGENASLGAAATESVEIDELQLQNAINSAIDTKRQLKNINPRDIKKQIKVIMRTHCWVIREEKSLIEGLSKIADLTNYLKNKGVDNSDNPSADGYEWARYVELYNLLLASKLMIEGSLIRKESRGAYNRSEYPDTDNVNWLKNLVYKNIDGKSIIDAIPVDLKYCAPSEFVETI
mgnify:CR=1 FL=1